MIRVYGTFRCRVCGDRAWDADVENADAAIGTITSALCWKHKDDNDIVFVRVSLLGEHLGTVVCVATPAGDYILPPSNISPEDRADMDFFLEGEALLCRWGDDGTAYLYRHNIKMDRHEN